MAVYLKASFLSPSAISALRQDLELLKKLVDYRRVNESICKVALKLFQRHLWYLNDYLTGLALFDDMGGSPGDVSENPVR